MHGPHVLILAPRLVPIEVPLHQAVDVDERVAVQDDAAHGSSHRPQRAPLGIAPIDRDPRDPTVLGRTHDPALAAGQRHGSTVPSHEPVRDALGVGATVGDGQEPMVGRSCTCDVGGLPRPVLGPASPGAVAHADAVDVDALAVQDEPTGDATELIEVARVAERGAHGAERFGGHHARERQIDREPVAVGVAECVDVRRLDHPDGRAGRQVDGGEVGSDR